MRDLESGKMLQQSPNLSTHIVKNKQHNPTKYPDKQKIF
jgi:hypothetical protein